MIWVIAGTLDGRNLAVTVRETTKEPVFVSVVSNMGRNWRLMKGSKCIRGASTKRR